MSTSTVYAEIAAARAQDYSFRVITGPEGATVQLVFTVPAAVRRLDVIAERKIPAARRLTVIADVCEEMWQALVDANHTSLSWPPVTALRTTLHRSTSTTSDTAQSNG